MNSRDLELLNEPSQVPDCQECGGAEPAGMDYYVRYLTLASEDSDQQAKQSSSNFSENAHVRDRWNAITVGGMMASTHETRMRSRAVSQVNKGRQLYRSRLGGSHWAVLACKVPAPKAENEQNASGVGGLIGFAGGGAVAPDR